MGAHTEVVYYVTYNYFKLSYHHLKDRIPFNFAPCLIMSNFVLLKRDCQPSYSHLLRLGCVKGYMLLSEHVEDSV